VHPPFLMALQQTHNCPSASAQPNLTPGACGQWHAPLGRIRTVGSDTQPSKGPRPPLTFIMHEKWLSQHLDTDLTHHMANTASTTLNSATLWNRWLWTEIWSNFNRGVLSPLGTNPSVSQFTPALALTHSSYQSTASPRARCRSWQARLCCRSQSSLHQPPQPTCLVTSHMNLGILQTG